MKLKTVLWWMAACGLVLGAYSLELHEHVLGADEAQVRHACRQLCKLGLVQTAGADGVVGDVVGAFAGRACEAMDDHTPVLLECRDRLTARGLSVAQWRCLTGSASVEVARGCADGL